MVPGCPKMDQILKIGKMIAIIKFVIGSNVPARNSGVLSRYLGYNNWLTPLMMVMMMNCFCGMADRRKAFSLISSQDHCQRYSPSRISNTARARYEPAQNLSSRFVEWRCAVVITTTPRRHWGHKKRANLPSRCFFRTSAACVVLSTY